MKKLVAELNWMERGVDGIVMDLGVSSPQLDDAKRGFSFLKEGPLDMRMDLAQKLDAYTWLHEASEEELSSVFRDYGEERFSKRIAKAIVLARAVKPIINTQELAAIVSRANPKWEKHKHPATRVFQAIRIYINDELHELQFGLESCFDVLAVGGRLLVISFHSLEDRCVKHFMRKYAQCSDFPLGVPVREDQMHIRSKCIGRATRASEQEVKSNPRARSAVLRVMEKLA
jgi:16S rRNA (cytosine1402-N4)-methyltransferase